MSKGRVHSLVAELLLELTGNLDAGAAKSLMSALRTRGRQHGPKSAGPTVTGLCNTYMKFAKSYYRKRDATIAKEAGAVRYALLPLQQLFGRMRAADFGPRRLKDVREAMIAKGWCRGHVNMQIGRIKRMFKWAVSNEIIPSDRYHALQAVDGLRAGRTEARESEPVKPVPEEMVEAILPHVAKVVAAMIRVQLLTGMRPGEVTIMRTCDIDQSQNPWTYRPEHHKTQQHGHERVVILGPKAQEIVRPFLRADSPIKYLFSPADADAERRRKLHLARKTPMSCGNRPGTNRKSRPRKKPGERYDTQAYGHAIRYGCLKAFPAPAGLDREGLKTWRREHRWHPHQLRHNAATKLRKEYGLDVAQVVLGHKTLAVTQVYAERDVAAAQKVMLQAG
jgi:integrase